MASQATLAGCFLLLLASGTHAVALGAACSSAAVCDSGSICADGICRIPIAGDPCDGFNKCSTETGRELTCKWVGVTRGYRCSVVVDEGGACRGFALTKKEPSVDFTCREGTTCDLKSDLEKETYTCQKPSVGTGEPCGDGIGRCGRFNSCLDDDSGSGKKICKRGVKVGGACDTNAQYNACAYNLYCPASNKCEAMLEEGASCSLTGGPICRGPPSSWGPELVCKDGKCQSKPLSRACGQGACFGDQTCVNDKCVSPDGSIAKGQPCDPQQSGAKSCMKGLTCAKADGRPATEISGDNVCVEYVESGCDVSSNKVCKGSRNSRTMCQNGQCVPSKIGLHGDTCGDNSGITCYAGDGCGEGALSCFNWGGAPPSSLKRCGAVDLEPGQVCDTGAKANPTGLRCAKGLRCYTPVLNARGICRKTVGEGEACNPAGNIFCSSERFACAGGKCVRDPTRP